MESRQRRVCYQSEGGGEYTLTRDAILRGAQITYQSFGLDKKLSNPIGLVNFLARFDRKDAEGFQIRMFFAEIQITVPKPLPSERK